MDSKVAQSICADLDLALNIGVGIVDLNDFGRSISPRSLSVETLASVLRDNPLCQQHRLKAPGSSASPVGQHVDSVGEQASLRRSQRVQDPDENRQQCQADR